VSPAKPAPEASKPSPEAHRGASRGAADLAVENERLRARLAALEAELVEIQARADAAVAAAQERAYWLDRWHLDLNALMRRPGAAELRASFRAARWFFRRARNLKRRWQNG
jgi:hypothetical protein